MSDQMVLSAEVRTEIGKGQSRALRRQGRVPTIVYGGDESPVALHVEEKALTKQLMSGHFMNSVVMIDIAGKQVRTLPKDVAFHPVSERPLHVDFLRLAAGATIQVAIPVRFVNEELSPGLKRGGVLNVVRHELDLICKADEIPDAITIDVEGYDVGESIHSSHVKIPSGAEHVITDRDFTIATIVAPSALKSTDGDTTVSDEAEGEEGEEQATEE